MRVIVLLIVLTAYTQAGETKKTVPTVISDVVLKDILSKRSHKLSFENYGNRKAALMNESERKKEIAGWDATKAAYVLDGHKIGVGKAGWNNLKKILSKLPKGSRIAIADYYGGGGFPFEEKEFNKLCKQYGISLGAPAL